MLIEFKYENFRAARHEQHFSLVATKNSEFRDTHLVQHISTEQVTPFPDLLRSAVIYGPNASGKTNFLMAIQTMDRIVCTSATRPPDSKLPITPFLFSKKSATQPTLFEITFASEGVRYQYGFTADSKQIFEEWLYAFPHNRAQKWFERFFDKKNKDYIYSFGDKLTGEKEVWRKSTRPNALFLSTAVQLNSKALQPIYNWFSEKLQHVSGGNKVHPGYTIDECVEGKKSNIISFLKNADIAVDDIEIVRQKIKLGSFSEESYSDFIEIPFKLSDDKESAELYRVNFLHKSDDNLVSLDINEESDGTNNLFNLAGPWLDVLQNGYILFVDELNQSLHPDLVRYLVSMFHNPNMNKKNAQLIFTTHETSILSQKVFRRDQIWFCERDHNQVSTITPLSDFSPRKGTENLEKAYLDGRYGALPILSKEQQVID